MNMGDIDLWAYAYLGGDGYCQEKINSLVSIARAERWDFHTDPQDSPHKILQNYINYTFKRLYSLDIDNPKANYIYRSDNILCFDTGLFTKNLEPIYALFKPNQPRHKTAWIFRDFFKKSSHEMTFVPSLPRRAEYFSDVKELIYDHKCDLRINSDHILDDPKNQLRIPTTYRNMPALPMLFIAAVEYAKIRIMENYKAAVPQYFNGRVQFLIPISLGDPSTVDLSLAVNRKDNVYSGRTCLTLDMAYNNARLIAKPESDWLVGK